MRCTCQFSLLGSLYNPNLVGPYERTNEHDISATNKHLSTIEQSQLNACSPRTETETRGAKRQPQPTAGLVPKAFVVQAIL